MYEVCLIGGILRGDSLLRKLLQLTLAAVLITTTLVATAKLARHDAI